MGGRHAKKLTLIPFISLADILKRILDSSINLRKSALLNAAHVQQVRVGLLLCDFKSKHYRLLNWQFLFEM